METVILYGNYVELEIPKFLVESIPMSGSADNAIEEIVNDEVLKPFLQDIDKDALVKELMDYGAWDEVELRDHKENLKRFIWVKGLDYLEENF